MELSLKYARERDEESLRALFLFDQQLAISAVQKREPIFIQMRLMWWRDAIEQPSETRPNANPLINLLRQSVERVMPLSKLVPLIDHWEAHGLSETMADRTAAQRSRGAALFTIAAQLVASEAVDLERWGVIWSLWDMAQRGNDNAADYWEACRNEYAKSSISTSRWPRELRTVAILRSLVLGDLKAGKVRDLDRPGVFGRIVLTGTLGG